MSEKNITRIRKVVTVFLSTLAIFGAAVAITLAALSTLGVVKVTAMNTDAMSPTVFNGALVIAQNATHEDVSENDIVLLQTAKDTLTVGRIISETQDGAVNSYTLQSDNRESPDQWAYRVSDDNIYKLTTSIPVLGVVFTVLSNLTASIIFIALVLAIGLAYLLLLHGRKTQHEDEYEDLFETSIALKSDGTPITNEDLEGLNWFKQQQAKNRLRKQRKRARISNNGADIIDTILQLANSDEPIPDVPNHTNTNENTNETVNKKSPMITKTSTLPALTDFDAILAGAHVNRQTPIKNLKEGDAV